MAKVRNLSDIQQEIAFTYKGDIYTVPSGERAQWRIHKGDSCAMLVPARQMTNALSSSFFIFSNIVLSSFSRFKV